MSIEIYAESVERGLLKTKHKLAELRVSFQEGGLQGKIEMDLILKIGKFLGEFTYYTAKEIDRLIDFCEESDEMNMETQKMIMDYQKELNSYEKEYENLLRSRPQEEVKNLLAAITEQTTARKKTG